MKVYLLKYHGTYGSYIAGTFSTLGKVNQIVTEANTYISKKSVNAYYTFDESEVDMIDYFDENTGAVLRVTI